MREGGQHWHGPTEAGVATNAAMNYATNALGANPLNLGRNISSTRLAALRAYFDVNNTYVLRKLQILLLPYRHKQWERQLQAEPGGAYRGGASCRPPL